MTDADLKALLDVPLFAGLSLARAESLADEGFVQKEPPGADLFAQGEMPRFLHLILEGRVALIGASLDGREAVIEIFGGGEMIVAPAVFLDQPYLMSARVVEAARLLFLPAARIRDLLAEDGIFARAATLMLARHWRLLARQLKEQKLKSGLQRLGAYLLAETDRREGAVDFELRLDRKTLASRLGMSPEHLSRAILQLAEIGIAVSGRRVAIADLKALAAFSLEDDLR